MAGLGWRKFQAGEVLTANNFQSYGVDQTVQVYAGTAARGSAIGTAVSEGMVSYLADSNVVEAYDGSAWKALAYSADVPGLAGMQLIKSQAIGTGVSSVTVSSAFSSTYDAYRIIITGGYASTDNYLNVRLGSATTQYYGSLYGVNYSNNTMTTAANSNATSWYFAASGTSTMLSCDLTITNPFFPTKSLISSNQVGNTAGRTYVGMLSDFNSYTSFSLTCDTGTITGGTIYVYGLKK